MTDNSKREITCLDCFWSGYAKDLRIYENAEHPDEVCPECGSDHLAYTDVIRRGLVKTKD